MASTTTTSTPLFLSSSSAPNAKAPHRPPAAAGVTLPILPPPPALSYTHISNTTAYCGKIARNVVAMATGEAPVEVAPMATGEAPVEVAPMATGEAPVEVAAVATGEAPVEVVATTTTETPDIVKTIQEAWDKVDDKYAVASLVVAGGVALWASVGMISAIDRLPLVPGVLELVGIGYTGWFAYKNLTSTPEREALFKKIKDTYNDITGSS